MPGRATTILPKWTDGPYHVTHIMCTPPVEPGRRLHRAAAFSWTAAPAPDLLADRTAPVPVTA
jgi:hypothetical protein